MMYNQLTKTFNMKTFRFWAGCLVAVFCMSMLAACDDDEEVSDSEIGAVEIVGLWEAVYDEGWEISDGEREEWDGPLGEDERIMISLNADGYFAIWAKGNENARNEGRYELDGKLLTFYYIGMEIVANVSFPDENTMVMEHSESDYFDRITFERR